MKIIRNATIALIALATIAADASAHGGQYTGPVPNPNRQTGGGNNPRGGGTTPGSTPTWENWWEHNKEDFFDVKSRRAEKSDQGGGTQEGYDSNALHQPPTHSEVRASIIPVLIEALSDKAADVRDAAGIAAGRTGDAPEVEPIKALIKDSSDSVREAGVLGLGLLKNPIAEGELIKLLKETDTDFKERGLVALALGLSGGQKAKDALLDRLGSESPFSGISKVRMRQVEGCRALGVGLVNDKATLPLLHDAIRRATTRESNYLPTALHGLALFHDPSSLPILESALEERTNDDRRSAAILAGRVLQPSDMKEVKAFIDFVKEENDLHAKYFGIISLGRIGGDAATTFLKTVFEKSKNRDERAFAAIALGITRDAAHVDRLTEGLTNERDVSLRGACAIALGILEHKAAAPAVLALLQKSGNPELSAHIVTAVAMLDHTAALPDIRKMTTEARNPNLARACGFALALLDDASSIEVLLQLLRDSGSIAVKGGMASALGRIGDKRAIAPLVAIFHNSAETNQTRAFAIVALGLIGDKSPRSEFARISIDCNFGMQNAEALLAAKDIY